MAADAQFSGVIRVDRGEESCAGSFGLADRRCRTPNTTATRLAIASGTKAFTALTVVSLIEDGSLTAATTARSVLGSDLPLIDDRVTVTHLLAHRSGVGDYLDEEATGSVSDYVLAVPVHRLDSTESYLAVLDGHATRFPPDREFSYCNSGYVLLALIAERVSGVPFADLVQERVCGPAGMVDTAFLRSDALPDGTATGYLAADGWQTNVLHLPVLGSGDGGLYSTVADVRALWMGLDAGRIVSPSWVAAMAEPQSAVPSEGRRYGLGLWLHTSTPVRILEGYDAGVSFRSVHDPRSATTVTTMANTSDGAWPITAHLEQLYGLA